MKVYLVSEVDMDYQCDLKIFDSFEKAKSFQESYKTNFGLQIQEFDLE